ncbi:MAG TPA: hypothetical protein VFL13_13235 [Candidatus Baltobacteraceae bacterium]|nr:hypothetical protein [Candidatus Baltobacteraceae bacterium]
MLKRFGLLLCTMLVATAIAQADQRPSYRGPVSASEQQFVKNIQADLMKRFPTVKDAEKAGYFRYTNEDNTGAISYANLQWASADIQHPSQLWYDKNGNLLGADFSVPYKSGDPRPNLFGVNPGRWYEFDDHIHWVTTANDKSAFDNYVYPGPFKAAGGDPAHPTAQTLVKMNKVKSASEVTHVFDMPGIWDLIVWVRPNPNGAFAYKNPNVKP